MKMNQLPIPKFINDLVESLPGVEMFLGGSRHFGYFSESSDYDFFIYLPPAITLPEHVIEYITAGKSSSLKVFLNLLNLEDTRAKKITNESKEYIAGTSLVKTNIFGFQVDLTFFEGNKSDYEE